ncbi:hypothetical protein ACLOJK_001588 [Asimina triloba]
MVSSGLMKIVGPCWRPSSAGEDSRRSDAGGRSDGLLWYKDSGQHANGEFSMAVIQANTLLEDQSQIESGPLSLLDSGPHGTFVGIYDGHGGPETSRFINQHLFNHLKKFISEQQGMSVDVIYKAFSATEEAFLSLVKKQWLTKPQIASVGSCCLVGIICNGTLYVANVGDSRVVLGRAERSLKDLTAIQLSAEHNASIESVRQELRQLHPDDSQIVVLKHKVWRVKGLIQLISEVLSVKQDGLILIHQKYRISVLLKKADNAYIDSKVLRGGTSLEINLDIWHVSRSIGDAYLKNSEFNREPLLSRFRLAEPFVKPILSAEPAILVHKLYSHDQFLIFASDGLWEHLSNQEAVDIVNNSPRNGVARRLVKAALQEAAKKREMRYSDLKKIDRGKHSIAWMLKLLKQIIFPPGFFGGAALILAGYIITLQTSATGRKDLYALTREI